MSNIVNHPAVSAFGLRSFACDAVKEDLGKLPKDFADSTLTLGNIISWIPIIGAIIGAIQIYAGYHYYKNDPDATIKEAGKGLIARGVAATLCMGPLLFVADIVTTVARQCIS